MKTSNHTLTGLRWVARISGSLILAFLLFMVLAHVFGNEENGNGFQNTGEIIAFVCFPISSIIGLSLALKWDGIGGIITVLGMMGLLIIRPDLLLAPLVMIPFIPGLLYTFYWAYTKDQRNNISAA